MNNKQQLQMIKMKEDAIKDEIKELQILDEKNDIKNYRSFNNVFISSVKTLMQILHRATTSSTPISIIEGKYEYYVNGEKVSIEERDRLTKLNPFINEFINNMIEKFTIKSKGLLESDRKSEENITNKIGYMEYFKVGITEHLQDYKYTQQIIDDYMKLLLD